MHAGNIYASLVSWLIAKAGNGEVVLRIEDLDRERSKQEFVDAIMHDYEMLGLTWDRGPFYQHGRDEAYQVAYDALADAGLIYPCYCSRADLHAASAPHRGEKLVYQGRCRRLSQAERQAREDAGKRPAFRLMVPCKTIAFTDGLQGRYTQNLASECGDFLVKRSDGAFAYQLAVVVDDAAQGVNSVTRGVDLLCSTPQQIYLQELLGLPTPHYNHLPLLVAEENRRLSKRDRDASLESLLATFKSPAGVIGHIASVVGLIEEPYPITPEELLSCFSLDALFAKIQIVWE